MNAAAHEMSRILCDSDDNIVGIAKVALEFDADYFECTILLHLMASCKRVSSSKTTGGNVTSRFSEGFGVVYGNNVNAVAGYNF